MLFGWRNLVNYRYIAARLHSLVSEAGKHPADGILQGLCTPCWKLARNGWLDTTGWWFGCHFLFSPRYWVAVIIPIDEVIFFRGVQTTKQQKWEENVRFLALDFFFRPIWNWSSIAPRFTWQTLKGSSIIIDRCLISLPTILYHKPFDAFKCMNIETSSCLDSASTHENVTCCDK